MFANLVTVRRMVEILSDDLSSGMSEGNMLRVVRQFIADARRSPDRVLAATEIELAVKSSGSQKWDALIAAAIDMALTEQERPLPEWLVDPEPLEPWWFFNGIDELNPRSMVQAPPHFAVRGVFIQRAALENL